ncbi:MAG: preprotein translocase subunit YajC [Deltaproteobacteria bacterium]|nr:preprotein translocase subunit YajC [Deltaproteobacteria bacterium]
MLGQAAPQGNIFTSMLPLVAIFAIFYFLMIRPQQKQQKKLREMLAALKKGDQVITRGGIYGTIAAITDNAVTLEIANNVSVKVSRDAVSGVVASAS